MQPRQQEEACNDNTVVSQFGRRPRVAYDGLIGEPVPLDQIELVLAIRRAERERQAEHIANERLVG